MWRRSQAQRCVVLTGASQGVGRATARAFARRGARLALIARNEEALAATCEEARQLGAYALPLVADVADAAQLDRAASEAHAALGRFDVWVNNAMASVFAPFDEITPEEFRRVTDVTYLGQVYGTRCALARMRAANHGVIVQVGSALAYRGIPLQSAYCGAKHAIKGFTESLRTELLHENSAVRVVMVQLPGLNTTQFELVRTRLPRTPRPVPPVYQPEIAADAIVWASEHPNRRELWVGGSTALAIVGNRIAPGLADRYLARTAFGGQQTRRRATPKRLRTDYLFAPVAGDHGAHGEFDDEARGRSLQLWLTEHRRVVIAGGVGVMTAAAAAARR
jgi:NAD(P)-dependent dehydrogenase (short-subunit alcohol dehydrogenase family)